MNLLTKKIATRTSCLEIQGNRDAWSCCARQNNLLSIAKGRNHLYDHRKTREGIILENKSNSWLYCSTNHLLQTIIIAVVTERWIVSLHLQSEWKPVLLSLRIAILGKFTLARICFSLKKVEVISSYRRNGEKGRNNCENTELVWQISKELE